MTSDELSSIATQWFKAFNDHDLESLLDLYHEDAQHYSPKLKVRQPESKGLIIGKAALRNWWHDSFDRLPSLRYEVNRLTPYEDRVFMEYTRHVEIEERMMVGEMLEIKDGKISKSIVFHT